jgi:hypothetical protein
MCLSLPDSGFLGERCVVFYSTSPEGDASLRAELTEFAKTMPPGVTFSLGEMDPAETKRAEGKGAR